MFIELTELREDGKTQQHCINKDYIVRLIPLLAEDNTEITWGAEVGKWQLHLESTDEQKLAKLYGYYKDYGTLSGDAKYINLRDPQDNIPLPIDKY